MGGKEKDEILKQYVKLGSRIVVSVPQKPPRYGRKISKWFMIIHIMSVELSKEEK